MNKTLILGANGMLGHALKSSFAGSIGWDLAKLDITNEQDVDLKISELNPAYIINAAAFTNVDGCEETPDLAMQVNGYAVKYLAAAAKKINATLIHFSTDYVFNGNQESGYKEDDTRDPINKYGESKALGEQFLEASGAKYYLARISWLYGPNGKNFVDTMLKLSETHPTLRVVNDQIGNPTYTFDVAEAVKTLIAEKYDYGIYHLVNSNPVSWHQFAKKIFEIRGIDIKVDEVSSEEFPRPAKRPHYSTLLNTKFPELRPYYEALTDYLS